MVVPLLSGLRSAGTGRWLRRAKKVTLRDMSRPIANHRVSSAGDASNQPVDDGPPIAGNHGGSVMTHVPQLSPLGAALGTEVLGIDLSKPLDESTFAWIQGAFAEHPVLVFPNQDLSAPELAAFGRRFGTPRPHALIKYRHADCPEVSWLTNVEETGNIDWYGVKRATDWHTDSTFEDTLPLLAVPHAKVVPSEKGGPRRGASVWRRQGRDREDVSRGAVAGAHAASGKRTADPIRQSHAHAW